MRRLWPVPLTAVAALHAIWTGNHAGFIVALWLGVIYVAWLARPTTPPPADLGHLDDLQLRRVRDRHQEPTR